MKQKYVYMYVCSVLMNRIVVSPVVNRTSHALTIVKTTIFCVNESANNHPTFCILIFIRSSNTTIPDTTLIYPGCFP